MANNNDKVVSLAGARSKEKDKEKETDNIDNQPVICSFCNRPNHMVIKMIKGPGVNICSECIMICLQYLLLEDKLPTAEAQKVLEAFWQGMRK
jgi:hypothetical protein